ncbi:unnamed protein product [Lactuca saligna]|uniref:40S ribosomal protein S25 n=1 Tax=Lactuca saligna TaxID=75948 RepID=A0AA36A3Q8_LACSI|nr:unnamed protein product [Lactuca saligna]
MIQWWVRKRQIRYVSGEARHGQGFVETQSTVISNVGNGRGQNMELVTEMGLGGHAFAILIAKCYKIGEERAMCIMGFVISSSLNKKRRAPPLPSFVGSSLRRTSSTISPDPMAPKKEKAPPPSSKPTKSGGGKQKKKKWSKGKQKEKINGSVARKAIRELMARGAIRMVSAHSSQQIYTRATNT